MVGKRGEQKKIGLRVRVVAFAVASLIGLATDLIHFAEAAPKAKKGAPTVAAPKDGNKGFRKKELNFEERVIEGLSNRGYESLSQTGSNDGMKGEKLYRKRAEFDEDSKSLLREMEYLK
jgi:hypothetical protein